MLQGVGLRFQIYPRSSPGGRFQKCAVSVCAVSIKTAAVWKKREAGTTKCFPVFRETCLCVNGPLDHKKKTKKQTKLFSFSFVFHFLPGTEIIVFFSVSFKHSSKVEATLLELFSPERKWRLPCVHVSVKKENKTKQNVWAVAMATGSWMTWFPSPFFRWVFFPARSRATLKKKAAAARNVITPHEKKRERKM